MPQYGLSIADMISRAGYNQAEAQRNKGDMWAGTVGGLGRIASGYFADKAQAQAEQAALKAKERALAPQREQEAQIRGIDLENKQAERDKRSRDLLETSQVNELFSKGQPTLEALSAVIGPERASRILEGLAVIEDKGRKRFTDSKEAVKKALQGFLSLPEGTRPHAYPMTRAGLIEAGHITPEMAPEAYDANWVTEASNYGEAAKEEKPDTRSIELQIADAKGRGDMATYNALLEASRAHANAIRAPKAPDSPALQEGGDPIFVGQPGYKKLTPAGKTAVTSMNNFIMDAQKYRKVLDKLTGKSGVNLTGEDAAELDSAHAALLFTAAKAFEQGALQAPDKAVVEQMIPNPAKWSSILKTLSQGGKAGQLRAMDTALANFRDRMKSTWGLSPTGEGELEIGTRVPGPASTGPKVGEQRMFDGKVGVWDGKGWKAK